MSAAAVAPAPYRGRALPAAAGGAPHGGAARGTGPAPPDRVFLVTGAAPPRPAGAARPRCPGLAGDGEPAPAACASCCGWGPPPCGASAGLLALPLAQRAPAGCGAARRPAPLRCRRGGLSQRDSTSALRAPGPAARPPAAAPDRAGGAPAAVRRRARSRSAISARRWRPAARTWPWPRSSGPRRWGSTGACCCCCGPTAARPASPGSSPGSNGARAGTRSTAGSACWRPTRSGRQLAACHAFLLPFRAPISEVPLVVIEAGLSGRPTIVLAAPGVDEIAPGARRDRRPAPRRPAGGPACGVRDGPPAPPRDPARLDRLARGRRPRCSTRPRPASRATGSWPCPASTAAARPSCCGALQARLDDGRRAASPRLEPVPQLPVQAAPGRWHG